MRVRPVERCEEGLYQELMQAHHYLGALPKISETLWYVASYHGTWVALLSFSAAAWKCAVRDRWIGWDFRHRYDRLKLVANNSRFLILPGWHRANLGSKVLSLCERRLAGDWQAQFGHPLVLLETFVDPARFRGTVYRAANWRQVGRQQRLPPYPAGIQRHHRLTQEGVPQTLAGRCPGGAVAARARSPLSQRRAQDHADGRSDAMLARLLC